MNPSAGNRGAPPRPGPACEGEPVRAVQVIPFRLRAQGVSGDGPLRAACLDCRVREHCLPASLPESALHVLDGSMFGRRRLRQGQAAYLEGDRFRCVYAVRHGSLKAAMALKDGREQVACFILPGELTGLDGMARGTYATTATALEDSEVCAIPSETLHELALKDPQWQDTLCRAMGQEIVREYRHMLVLGSAGTEARVAMFLLEVSEGMRRRGFSATEFWLRMSRAEIGSYLGLTLETVSRTLSSFHHQGLLEVHKRHVVIRSLQALRDIREREGA